MRKTNAALLETIDRLESEVRIYEKIIADERSAKSAMLHKISEQEADIKWLKRIVEGLTQAPSIPTRPR